MMRTKPSDMALAAVAETQRGLFTRRQASGLGFSANALAHREATGRIRRLHPSVFAFAAVPTPFEVRVLAACLAIDRAVASHESAAWLHGLTPPPARRIVVTVPPGCSTRLNGVVVHRSRWLPDRHIASAMGAPVTSRIRTILDMAGICGVERLGRMLDEQLVLRTVTMPELLEQFEAWATYGRPGARRMRRVLVTRCAGSVMAESELERRFHRLLTSAGLPVAETQFRPPWGGTLIGRVDVAFVEQRLVVELDGRRWHSRDEAFETDRRRDQLAVVAGWRVLRFTWKQVTQQPTIVLDTLRAALV